MMGQMVDLKTIAVMVYGLFHFNDFPNGPAIIEYELFDTYMGTIFDAQIPIMVMGLTGMR